MAREANPVPLFPEANPTEIPDDSREETRRQVAALAASAPEFRMFGEFRRKVALFEILNKALETLAQALRFSGRLTVSFHQGRITKVSLKEAHYRNHAAR